MRCKLSIKTDSETHKKPFKFVHVFALPRQHNDTKFI